jgi:hypothetical protein
MAGIPGVTGTSLNGDGVLAVSFNQIGVSAQGGLAPLLLVPASGAAGPPATGTHSQGEVFVDSAGNVYVCTAGGAPGTWQRMVPAAPGYNNLDAAGLGTAGSLNLLTVPIRAFDTTVSDPPADKTRASGPLVAGSTTTISLTGYKVDGIAVPLRSVGVIANLTARNASGPGTLTAYQAGSKVPVPPTLSFAGDTTVATLCIVGISSAGKMSIKATGATDCYVDVVGFLY